MLVQPLRVTNHVYAKYSERMEITPTDIAHLIRDKYDGDKTADLAEDLARLASGEPLAYVIGWIPFLGLRVRLDSFPLIPRPETEWWTEELCTHIKSTTIYDSACSVLDLCAGSGVIGLSVLSKIPVAQVSFGELSPLHSALISVNIDENNLGTTRATVRSGDLFAPYANETFDIIATNPPYIPTTRTLEECVTSFEPSEALFSGPKGLDIIERIINEAPEHLNKGGELWMECDTTNIETAAAHMKLVGFTDIEIRTDLYGRPRLVMGYFS